MPCTFVFMSTKTNKYIPQTSCFTNAIANSSCSEDDLYCICNNEASIITTLESCTNLNCTINDELSEYFNLQSIPT